MIPAEHIVRIDQVDKVVETDYSSKLVAAIEEGWTRLHERLSIKFLLESKDAFSDGVNTDGIFILNKMKESRVFNDSLYMNHYWLGQQIVGAIFVDGFRGDVPDFNGGVVELMNIRKTNGLENVKKFLLKLDLEKIADPGSRRLFETTRFEEDVEAKEVRRKVWEEDGEKMRLVWKMDKKNTLLDYMTSTDPEKRRKGQEKFLELFGK